MRVRTDEQKAVFRQKITETTAEADHPSDTLAFLQPAHSQRLVRRL